MKTYIYSWYDKQIGAYSQPFTTNFKPDETKESIGREMLKGSIPAELENKELYYLGCFHDNQALFELEPNKEFLLTINIAKKEKRK